MTYYTKTPSPIGELLLASDGKNLIRVSMDQQKHAAEIEADWVESKEIPVLRLAVEQLKSYFAGLLNHFDLPLAFRGTEFQIRVWRELEKIPYGQTISYRELAKRIGNVKASRAVGMANGKNPLPIVVPCHRVIGASGQLTGYAGGVQRKTKLLELEGNFG